MDTALTNGMRIRVQRYLDLTVTADGKTTEKSVAAENYSDAVEAMGITLGENDRILVATAEGEKQVKAEDNVSSCLLYTSHSYGLRHRRVQPAERHLACLHL